MAKVFEKIDENIQKFIEDQHMFFVGSAPMTVDGHVNISPKGMDSFRVLGPNRVVYMDLTGSGNETSAHVLENGRITIMFVAFKGAPNIVRLFGKGEVILPDTPEWDELKPLFPEIPGMRQMIAADIHRVQTSCGYAVPLYDYKGDRDQLVRWAEAKGEEGIITYWRQKNMCSIDDLPTPLSYIQPDENRI
jgi:hypothetical protein